MGEHTQSNSISCTAELVMDFEIIQSIRGKPKLCYNGYMYNVKNNMSNKITWSCVKRQTKCPGMAKTNLEMRDPEEMKQHNHDPNAAEVSN